MKTIVMAAAVLLVAHQVYAAPPPAVVKCMQDNGVTGADLVKFAESGEASDGMKCNFKCVMMATGALSEDGKLSVEPVLERTPEGLHQSVKDCVNIEPSSDLCEYAYRNHVCLREKGGELYKQKTKKLAEMLGQ